MSSSKAPKAIGWREERRRIDAYLAARAQKPEGSTLSSYTVPNTAQRVARKRTKAKNVEKVLRWQSNHPQAVAAKQSRYRRRIKQRRNARKAA